MAKYQSSTARRTKAPDPYRYGWRYSKSGAQLPLTEADILHPREGDFIVTNDYHDLDRDYLRGVVRLRIRERRDLLVLSDHRIDFQQGGIRPMGPDTTLLQGEVEGWDHNLATFPVVDMKSRTVFVAELTSKSTRKTDLTKKLDRYYRAGVPLYLIFDTPYGGGRKPRGLEVYRAGAVAFERVALTEDRYWIEEARLFVAIRNGRAICLDEDGKQIGDYIEVALEARAQKARADEEKARAEQEKARAEQEKARAEQEKARADEEKARADEETVRAEQAERRIRELEAELLKLKR